MRTSFRSSMAIVATAALTLALAGCGGGDDSGGKTVEPQITASADDAALPTADGATAEATPDDDGNASTSAACELLDNDTITAVTGVDFAAAVASDDSTGTCTWDLTDSGGFSLVSVTLDESGDASYEITKGVVTSMFDDVVDASIPGADHAFTYMGGAVVAMDFNGTYVQVMFMSFDANGSDPSIPNKLAEAVAKKM